MPDMFRSLRVPNYRIWAGGALISNIGSWMQRAAQDWLVLTQLTDHSAMAVGVTTGLQFGPQLLLMPITGTVADRFSRHMVLLITNAAMGIAAFLLGALTLSGEVQLWQVYGLAGLLGCISAFDGPARQTIAGDLVSEADLSNAIALNSSSFNMARLVGPATAGILISAVGTGWVFLVNALTFVPMLAALVKLRNGDPGGGRFRGAGVGMAEGFRQIFGRTDLVTVLAMLTFVTAVGINSPIFISTMVTREFHAGAEMFGFLTSALAVGSLIGALLNARRGAPDMTVLTVGATAYAVCLGLAALAPVLPLFALALLALGVATQTFTSNCNSYAQISTDPSVRGRTLAVLFAIPLGCVPLGSLLVGYAADHWGARWGIGLGAGMGSLAAVIGLWRMRS